MSVFKKNEIVGLCAGIIIVSVVVFLVTNRADHTIEHTCNQFISALVENRQPVKYCSGEVLYKVKTRNIIKAKVISINTKVIDVSQKYARTYVETEIELSNGTSDVGFYEIDLFKDKETWKVIALRETMPNFKANIIQKPGLQEAITRIYQDYFNMIGKKDTSLLAGPAKTAYEKQPQKPVLKGSIGNLQTKIVYAGKKLVIAEHEYQYDNRPVKVLVQYYLTGQGYKIVAVQLL
ncbi:hypothetical protein [Syntrophomonas palmitatica]|uniref:hypothetical protein n=1 Tax=Syntrophomonas palmitatica TaxID=402877 RepID=UPI0006D1BF12|nr:hypothetical protein [Syntrophomonas palmitatica]